MLKKSLVVLLAAMVAAGGAAQPVTAEKKFVLVIHGGAGTVARDLADSAVALYHTGLLAAIETGEAILKNGGSALDAVEAAVLVLEDNPAFNAGKGAVLNADGEAELDASIMDGASGAAGAVCGVRRVKNPIHLARLVMEKTSHVLLTASGAERFAEEEGIPLVDPSYFITPQQLESWKRRKAGMQGKGTVGAVALDIHGNIAAATSTGGLMMKKQGRIGDAPIIGAGTYANNATCAISCTGWGEKFIKQSVAFHISAVMEYKGVPLPEAVEHVFSKKLQAGDGGVIGLDRSGNYILRYNTASMLRGVVTSSGIKETKIWE